MTTAPARREDTGGPRRHALLVGAGLATVGAGSATSLAVAARALEVADFAAFATWWTAANLVGLAFVVVEMYLPRPLLALRVHDGDDAPVIAAFTRLLLVAVATGAALLLAAGAWAVPRLFDGETLLLLLLLPFMLAMALQTLERAVAIGRGRFHVFTVQLGVDGLVRCGGSVALAVTGDASAVHFAAVMCLGPVAGVVAASRLNPRWWAWRRSGGMVPLAPIALLALATLAPLVVNNAGVPWLAAQEDVSRAAVGAVAGALTLSRLPTLLVGAAYGPLLAPLAAAVEAGHGRDFRRVHRRALAAACATGGLFVAAFAAAGPVLLATYLGQGYELTRLQLTAMAGGSAVMFVSVVEQAALTALSAWSRVAIAWAIGVASFGGVLLLPVEPVTAASFAVLVAPLVATGFMSLARIRVARSAFDRS